MSERIVFAKWLKSASSAAAAEKYFEPNIYRDVESHNKFVISALLSFIRDLHLNLKINESTVSLNRYEAAMARLAF